MSNMDILQVSARLEADKRLSTLFDIMRDYGDTPAALWLKEDKEFSRSYKEITRRADDLAAYLTEHTPKGGWIAIAVDTCHYWPTLFWGVIRSGHNALLLDASAPDNVIQGLLDEANCRCIISRKPRALAGNVRQIDFKEVREAPRTIQRQKINLDRVVQLFQHIPISKAYRRRGCCTYGCFHERLKC